MFNFYTRLRKGYIFSARMRIVKAMEAAMLKAESKERKILPEAALSGELSRRPIQESKETP